MKSQRVLFVLMSTLALSALTTGQVLGAGETDWWVENPTLTVYQWNPSAEVIAATTFKETSTPANTSAYAWDTENPVLADTETPAPAPKTKVQGSDTHVHYGENPTL